MPSSFAYHIKHKNGWGTGFGPGPTHCATCGASLPVNPPNHTGGTGYGCGHAEEISAAALRAIPIDPPPIKPGEVYERSPAHCYQCCANSERARLIETGRGMLYLLNESGSVAGPRDWHLGDWAGKLQFPVTSIRKGAHNMARTRYDVTFIGPDGKPWRGTQYGENTQICHVRRIGGKAGLTTKHEEV